MPRHKEKRFKADTLRDVLQSLGANPIAYLPVLTALMDGSPAGGVFLSQCVYWTSLMDRKMKLREGWFWKSHTEWTLETGLSRKRQRTERARAVKKGYLEERSADEKKHVAKHWTNRSKWYRINVEKLVADAAVVLAATDLKAS